MRRTRGARLGHSGACGMLSIWGFLLACCMLCVWSACLGGCQHDGNPVGVTDGELGAREGEVPGGGGAVQQSAGHVLGGINQHTL